MKLPAASFVSMVDAVLCAVSVLIIMIVVLPRTASQPGYLPRAEMAVSCAAQTPAEMTISVSRRGGLAREVRATISDTPPNTVRAIRGVLVEEMKQVDGVSVRLAIAADAGPYASLCLDLVACAVERRERACRIRGVDPWQIPKGAAIPIVSVLYGPAENVAWQ